MVGRVLVHATMSLDGFIAGPDDAMDWVFEYMEPSAADDEVIKTTGAMLGGRRSYDVGKTDAGKESGTLRRGLDWTGVRAHPVAARRAPVGSSFDVCRARVRARVDAAGGDDLDVLDSSSLTQTRRLRYSHPPARARISTAIDGTYARHPACFWAGRRAGRHQDSCECQQCCYRQLVPEGALQRW